MDAQLYWAVSRDSISWVVTYYGDSVCSRKPALHLVSTIQLGNKDTLPRVHSWQNLGIKHPERTPSQTDD